MLSKKHFKKMLSKSRQKKSADFFTCVPTSVFKKEMCPTSVFKKEMCPTSVFQKEMCPTSAKVRFWDKRVLFFSCPRNFQNLGSF